jgi:hypothetical protein
MGNLKRGAIRDDGKIFYRYDKNSKNGECWMKPSTFAKMKDAKRKWASENPDKVKNHLNKTRVKNKDKNKEKIREDYKKNPTKYKNQFLKYRYGITLDEYNQMLISQNGVCEICNQKCPSGYALSVDHCHKTGKVRGLLCVECNTGIGKLQDSVEILSKAISYLVKKGG